MEDPVRNKDSIHTFSDLSSALDHSLEFVMFHAETGLKSVLRFRDHLFETAARTSPKLILEKK